MWLAGVCRCVGLPVREGPGDGCGMPTKTLSCFWCKSREEHRTLSEKEKVWLRNEIGERYVEDYYMCLRDGCRKVRTYWKERRFRDPLMVPESD